MQSSSGDSDLLIVADPAVAYGSTDMSKPSPTPGTEKVTETEKITEIETPTPTTDEHVVFIEHTSRVPSSAALVNKTANLVYVIFLLHGVGTLMPWNSFLTIAPKYFIDYKFHPLEHNATIPNYSKYFFSYLGICSQLPNLLLNFLNLFIVVKADLSRRIVYSLLVVAVCCLFTIAFIFVDTYSWMLGFFVLTMVSVVILNSANGIYQNSIYGLTALFPTGYTNAVIIGNNLCGIFITVVLIITLLFFKDTQFVAMLYFSTALITILACLFSFLWLPKIPFYVYHTNQARLRNAESLNAERNFTFADFMVILKQTKMQMLSVFLTFFVTLALFPAIVSDIHLYPISRAYDFFLPEKLYVPVTTFLNFNVFATLGNIIAGKVQWPNSKNLIWPVALRLLFIPYFLFSNYGITRNFPVYFTSEYAFIFMLALMSLTHGYFSSISLMYAPIAADQSRAKDAGQMSAFFLVLGIAAGVSFTFLESFIFLGA